MTIVTKGSPLQKWRDFSSGTTVDNQTLYDVPGEDGRQRHEKGTQHHFGDGEVGTPEQEVVNKDRSQTLHRSSPSHVISLDYDITRSSVVLLSKTHPSGTICRIYEVFEEMS